MYQNRTWKEICGVLFSASSTLQGRGSRRTFWPPRNPALKALLVDGYVYGFNDTILTCLEFATGKMMWRDRSVGKGSVTFADGHLYIQGENSIVGLAEATPDGYREKGRFEIPEKGQLSWAHPVISDGRLYVRNQDILLAYDIKAAR